MNPSQEPKYCIIDEHGNPLPNARIANRATGKPIPDDEPIMIFRAKDVHAQVAIASYIPALDNTDHAKAVELRFDRFQEFKEANPDRVKEPD